MNACQEITATNLREFRRVGGFTQTDIARMLGVDNTAISCIEKGNRQLAHAEKLVLECYLLGKVPSLNALMAKT